MFSQKGNFLIPVVVTLLLVSFIIFFPRMKDDSSSVSTAEVPVTVDEFSQDQPKAEYNSAFQELLVNNCLNQNPRESQSGEINIDRLPVDLTGLYVGKNFLKCGSGNGYDNFVLISLDGDSFITISDKYSKHCCHGPSSLEPTGKLVKEEGEEKIYMHTGTWGAGPGTGYRPLIARGVRDIKLKNGEDIRIIIDRYLISQDDAELQKIEDKYKVDSGQDIDEKVLTPESVDKMLSENYFDVSLGQAVINDMVHSLRGITLRKGLTVKDLI